MAFAPCAVCKRIYGVAEMYFCSNCEFWLCREHVETLFGEVRCPRCKKPLRLRGGWVK